MLCDICFTAIFTGRRRVHYATEANPLPTYFPLHPSMPQFLASVQAKCPICLILGRRVPECFLNPPDGKDTSELETPFIHWAVVSLREERFSVEFRTLDAPPFELNWDTDSFNNEAISRSTPTNTGSVETLSLAQKWLSDCVENHPQCQRVRETPFVPTRLIDVTENETSDWRLYVPGEQDNIPQFFRYLTLSHCWGQLDFMRLLSSNVDTLKAGLRLSDLTKTFREAIMVVRQLGEKYIWIDSLCIVQDSQNEWRAECSRMTDVYENSWCNIAATDSTDGNGGLFRERNPADVELVSVTSQWTDVENKKFYLHNPRFWEQGVLSAPLNCRAWVLQERLLSPRILHFGKYQLFWQCRQAACETYPNGTYKYEEPSKDFAGLQQPATLLKEQFPYEGPYHIWGTAVGQYMRCDLTRPSDKLVAISGVTRHLQRVLTDDEYLAGLWRSRLLIQLCWCLHPQTLAKEPPPHRAPSWSWASVDGVMQRYDNGPLDMENSSITPLAEVLEARTFGVTDDPTGEVTGGYIVFRASIVPVELWELGSNRSIMIVDGKSLAADVLPDLHVEPGETFCLPLFVVTSLLHTSHMRMYGLIVNFSQRHDNLMDGYIRYGMFSISLGVEGSLDAFGIKVEPTPQGQRKTQIHHDVEKREILLV